MRRDKLYKGVWIEKLPVKHCPHCHEDGLEGETVQLMEGIAANQYAKMAKRPVARVA